jgi:hydrogenase/urease accessory protein HupE
MPTLRPTARFAFVLPLAILASWPAAAHDLYRSESKLEVQRREVKAAFTFNLLDFPGVDQNGDKRVDQQEFHQSFDRVYAAILQHYTLDSNGPPVRFTREKAEVFDEHVLTLVLRYVFPQDILAIRVNSTLPDVLGGTHIHLVSVVLNGRVQEGILDNRTRTAFFSPTTGSNWQTFVRFLWLGIQHIATGYDHLAFLLGLLIATASMRSLVKVVTSFTVAHSITLGLATFSIVVLPSRFTESMIAASIVYVGVENLIRGRAIERYRVTFLFGLVHGFGFSNVLREMQLPRTNLALSLFSFNLGVEVGQLIFVVLLFPAIDDLIQSGRTWLRPAVSAVIALLATYWFIQRAFFGSAPSGKCLREKPV